MPTLLIAEILQGQLIADATAKAVKASEPLGAVDVICVAEDATQAATEAAKIDGVGKVIAVSDAAFAHNLAEPVADLIVSMAKGYSHIVAPATTSAKNILPRVAALLDMMIISDISEILDENRFERLIYAGNAVQVVKSSDAIKIVSIRIANYDAANSTGNASVETVDSGTPNDDFAIIEKLADKLSAAVGASRAAVDSGYAPNDWQVGQTGKVVAPELYIAVGISGAIQHLAGMKDSKIIVAINKDEEAPIFQIADIGLVADLFQAVPELIDSLS